MKAPLRRNIDLTNVLWLFTDGHAAYSLTDALVYFRRTGLSAHVYVKDAVLDNETEFLYVALRNGPTEFDGTNTPATADADSGTITNGN